MNSARNYTAKMKHSATHTSTHCNTLQHTATHCNTLQHTTITTHVLDMHNTSARQVFIWKETYHMKRDLWMRAIDLNSDIRKRTKPMQRDSKHVLKMYRHLLATCCVTCTLQHTAAHCNTLQHTAAQGNTLQHIATHCNTLPLQYLS